MSPLPQNGKSIIGRWDVDHVGQWTAWQSLRTADVMIVGQDWAASPTS
jgi:hypothetical protein